MIGAVQIRGHDRQPRLVSQGQVLVLWGPYEPRFAAC